MSEDLEPMSAAQAARFMDGERARTAAERALFEEHVEEWAVEHHRKWVLLKEKTVHGFFASFEDAFQAGDAAFPAQDMYIKQIVSRTEAQPMSLGLLHGVLVVDD